MNDRELLEAAAKAYGLPLGYEKGEWFWCEHGSRGAGMYQAGMPAFWNSDADDGDALRLAVKLGVGIDASNGRTSVFDPNEYPDSDTIECELWSDHVDACAATRRAITRAAAQLAQATQEKV